MNEMKPCPFCGRDKQAGHEADCYFVIAVSATSTQSDKIAAWDRRVNVQNIEMEIGFHDYEE